MPCGSLPSARVLESLRDAVDRLERMTALAHFCLRQMLALLTPVVGAIPAGTGDA